MSTSENLPVLSREFHAREIRNAFLHFDITGIFNVHATKEDARASVEHVKPDSTVYVEGYNTELHEGKTIHDFTLMLAMLRRDFGKDDSYYELKHAVLEQIKILQWRDALQQDKGPTDFTEHMLEEARLLIEKDCDVIVADYQHPANTEIQDIAQQLSGFIENGLDLHSRFNLDGLTSSKGVAGYVDRLAYATLDAAEAHDQRELHAGLHIAGDVLSIIRNPEQFVHIERTNEGKIRSYIIYGTAHAKSLTYRLEQMGATIRPIIVDNRMPDSRYFEKSIDDFYDNRRRRYAMTTFSAIMYNIGAETHTAHYKSLIEELYTNLEELNDDRDRAMAFCANCLKILAKSANEPEAATKEFERLIQPYVSEPFRLGNIL